MGCGAEVMNATRILTKEENETEEKRRKNKRKKRRWKEKEQEDEEKQLPPLSVILQLPFPLV